ncbi:hypothetical protein D3C73_1013470 [compost metagenome]
MTELAVPVVSTTAMVNVFAAPALKLKLSRVVPVAWVARYSFLIVTLVPLTV